MHEPAKREMRSGWLTVVLGFCGVLPAPIESRVGNIFVLNANRHGFGRKSGGHQSQEQASHEDLERSPLQLGFV